MSSCRWHHLPPLRLARLEQEHTEFQHTMSKVFSSSYACRSSVAPLTAKIRAENSFGCCMEIGGGALARTSIYEALWNFVASTTQPARPTAPKCGQYEEQWWRCKYTNG